MSDKPTKYNFEEYVPSVSRHTLRKGQAALYDLITEKVNSGDAVTLEEAKEIWLSKVHRNMQNGKPHRYTYYPAEDGTNNWYGKYVPMSEDYINFTVINWLMKNTGLLVMKGYLKVIPQVRLV